MAYFIFGTSFRLENEIKRFKSLAQDVYQKNLAVTRYDALFDPVIITISTLCIFLTLIVGSYFVFNNEISTGDLATIINYIYQLNWPMMAIGFMKSFNGSLSLTHLLRWTIPMN